MRRIKFKVVRTIGEQRISVYAQGSYNLYYPKDAIVRAREGTLGVAVFGRKIEAERFCSRCSGTDIFEIVRVLPIGRGKTVKNLSRSQSMYMLDIFYGSKEINRSCYHLTLMEPPLGTMFYPAVEVLE